MDPVAIDNVLSARNFRISTQSNGHLMILTDIYNSIFHAVWGTATIDVQPSAQNGKLVMTVNSINVQLFVVFTLPSNFTSSYKAKIENMLNTNLGNALAGKFTVNGVSVGGGTPPCAAADSLILQGTTNLG